MEANLRGHEKVILCLGGRLSREIALSLPHWSEKHLCIWASSSASPMKVIQYLWACGNTEEVGTQARQSE